MVEERLERIDVPREEGAEPFAVELVARDTGRGSPTVLCLHGFGDNLHTWQRLREIVEPHGARVVAVDLPGFGRSPLPAGFARPYFLHAVALTRALVRRRAAGGDRIFLAGNSLGGAVGLALAAVDARAERRVDGCLLLAPATPDTRLPVFAELLRAPVYRWGDGVQRRLPARARRALAIVIARAAFGLILAPGARPEPDWREAVVASFTRPGCIEDVERIALDVLWSLRGKSPRVAELWSRVPEISTPLTLIHGDADRVVARAEVRRVAELVPHARLVELPGVGHCPQNEAAARCAEELFALIGGTG